MTADARREMGERLIGELDRIQSDMDQRAKPYRDANDRADERDRARRWAVHYEQVAHEMTRRIQLAHTYLDGMPCVEHHDSDVDCPRCELEAILQGDVE